MTTAIMRNTLEAPRWARRTAHLIPLLTLPSGLWRVALVMGLPIMNYGYEMDLAESATILSLSVVQELAALLALGLVQPWGEVVPRWIPLIGGKVVRPMAAVVPAVVGSVILTALWTVSIVRAPGSALFERFDDTFDKVLVTVCYVPLLAWGPLLMILALNYGHRHRG